MEKYIFVRVEKSEHMVDIYGGSIRNEKPYIKYIISDIMMIKWVLYEFSKIRELHIPACACHIVR